MVVMLGVESRSTLLFVASALINSAKLLPVSLSLPAPTTFESRLGKAVAPPAAAVAMELTRLEILVFVVDISGTLEPASTTENSVPSFRLNVVVTSTITASINT